MQQISVAEQYYDRLEVNVNLPRTINLFLDKKALERPEVSESVWEEIKNSADYNSFKSQVLEVIPDYYTDAEMQSILDANANRPHVPITKLNFRKQLMILGKKFAYINFMETANAILSEHGYSSIDI